MKAIKKCCVWGTSVAVLFVLLSVSVLGASLVLAKGQKTKLTDLEKAFMDAIDDDYAWEVTETLTYGGRVVTGSEKAYETALWIENQLANVCGLGEENVYLEAFPVVSAEIDEETAGFSIGYTSLEVNSGDEWMSIPAVQCHEGDGTGPDGVTAEIADVGEGKLKDFLKLGPSGVEGKIVLFTRTELLFYGTPVLHQAANLGALAAICHFPKTPDDDLKIDVSDEILPLVYITDNDAALIRSMMESGPVEARLVVDNEWTEEPTLTAHNVIGMIPGAVYPDQFVYVGAHFDHWFTSAADDNSGLGSLLSMAKAVIDSGIQPDRTLVFCAFDAEEMGGWADTWYDWCMGSYSHIVETLDGNVLNPDLPGKIVAMFNMDVIATKNTIVYIETTPELTKFVRRAASDSGLLDLGLQTYIYWPPSSFDDWPFYQAGVPCTEIFWWGEEYDRIYHTTGDTLATLDPLYLRINTIFNGLMMLRMSEAAVLPYNLPENMEAIELGLQTLYALDPDAASETDLSSVVDGLEAYASQLDRLERLVSRGQVDVDLLNRKMMESAVVLNPVMFDWDLTAWIPGWTGISIFDNPANDLSCMKTAIAALEVGDPEAALDALSEVATMRWGRFVDYQTYMSVLGAIYYVEPGHLLWGEGFLPPLSDVHQVYTSIEATLETQGADYAAEIDALSQKVEVLYGEVDALGAELGQALSDAAEVLSEAR
ncbi:TPA: M28 family peptidase [Thermoplasmata archaeon]|nr:M28 family peptidase [Thermoplasmata archaeon]